jgi:DivIVA domain-containing protein
VTQHEHPFHYYRSPAEIRDVQFSHRIRGVDEYEVAEFLDLLADQVHATDLELTRLREETDRLRAENEHLRTDGRPAAAAPRPTSADHEGSPQAASLLLNAQRVADDLVEEAVRRVRDMLTVARAERSAILRNAQEAAAAMLVEAREAPGVVRGAHSSRHEPPAYEPPGRDSSASDSPLYDSSMRDAQRQPAPRHASTRYEPPRYEAPETSASPSAESPANLSIARQRTWQLDGQAAV